MGYIVLLVSRISLRMVIGATAVLRLTSVASAQYIAVYLHPTPTQASSCAGGLAASQFGWRLESGGTSYQSLRATEWDGSGLNWSNLHPSDWIGSAINDSDGSTHAGFVVGNGLKRAYFWPGGGNPGVVLHPSGYVGSEALGVGGSAQVGTANTGSTNHAFLWTGSAGAGVDLHPVGYDSSLAFGTDGAYTVGHASSSLTHEYHAIRWQQSAASAVDLHPAGYASSVATAEVNGLQYGWATTAGFTGVPGVWSGSAQSFTSMLPAWSSNSRIEGAAGIWQAGTSLVSTPFGDAPQATVWTGTGASAINLHQFLPAGDYMTSYAFSVDPATGIVFGQAGVSLIPGWETRAVMWVPIPAPGTLGLLVGLAIMSANRPSRN